MANRNDGRRPDELRPVRITRGFIGSSAGSVLIEAGRTRVICAVTIQDDVPPFLEGKGQGWVTAEYSMLPASTGSRKARDRYGKVDGRTLEIQRIVGRAMRTCVDMELIGERTLWIDCDVIEADGGTRAAAITGAYVAVADAARRMVKDGMVLKSPVKRAVAAVSAGIVAGVPLLDLCYEEDSRAAADMNLAMGDDGKMVEVQCTAEKAAFGDETLQELLRLGKKGIQQLFEIQKAALGG
ncbi:MAG: ribonuclease PH [Planctomycetota bacterium]|nr:ribonuclease PH [Planctomycetota bacterium]